MHVFADLRAAAHGGPGVHHGAFVHVGADVDVRGHQDRPFGDVAAAPRHGWRHHAHAGGFHRLRVQVGEFGLYFVEKAQVACAHDRVVFEAERQQHGLFDPLVHGPLAHALARGHTQAAFVELADDVFNGVGHFFGCRGDREVGTVVPCCVDDGLELLSHERAGELV